jgi:hypothetical protein
MADGSLQNTPTRHLYVQQGHSLFAQVDAFQSVSTWSSIQLGSNKKASVNSTSVRKELDSWAALRDPPGGRVIYLVVLSAPHMPTPGLKDIFTLTIGTPMADGSVQKTQPMRVYVHRGQSLFSQLQVYQPAITWSYLQFGNQNPISFDKAPVDTKVMRDLDKWAALPDPPGGRVIYVEDGRSI